MIIVVLFKYTQLFYGMKMCVLLLLMCTFVMFPKTYFSTCSIFKQRRKNMESYFPCAIP